METNNTNNTAEILNLQTDTRVMRETARENAAERYPFAYVLNVGGKFYSLVNAEQWETQNEMQSTKFGIWNGAHLFKKSATVFVYALCRDGFYRLCTSMNVHPGEEILPAFHKTTARPGQTRPRPTAKVGHKSAADIYAQAARILDELAARSWDGKQYTDTATLYARMDAVRDTQERYTQAIARHFGNDSGYLSNGHYMEPVARSIYTAAK